MRILLLARSLDTGGAERQLALLARGMRERGHDIRVATFYAGGALEGEIDAAGVPRVPLGKRSRWDVAGFGARLLRVVRRADPDVLVSYLVAPNLLAAALRSGFPRTRVVWSLRASDMDLNRYDVLSRVSFSLSISLSRRADLLLVNSRAGLRYHAEAGFPRARMRLVPNGIDVTRFHPDRKAGEALRRIWSPAPGARLVGLVGRVDPMKDPETFLRAADLVARRDPATRFVWIGPSREATAWKTHPIAIRLASRLTWAGEVPDMASAYNALDVLALSSRTEGFPNAVAEAMSCGVPCAVTAAGDAEAIVGDTGAVAAPRDAAGLADGIVRLLDAGHSPPRPEVRERILRNFSAEAMLDRTESLLSGLAGGGE